MTITELLQIAKETINPGFTSRRDWQHKLAYAVLEMFGGESKTAEHIYAVETIRPFSDQPNGYVRWSGACETMSPALAREVGIALLICADEVEGKR